MRRQGQSHEHSLEPAADTVGAVAGRSFVEEADHIVAVVVDREHRSSAAEAGTAEGKNSAVGGCCVAVGVVDLQRQLDMIDTAEAEVNKTSIEVEEMPLA